MELSLIVGSVERLVGGLLQAAEHQVSAQDLWLDR